MDDQIIDITHEKNIFCVTINLNAATYIFSSLTADKYIDKRVIKTFMEKKCNKIDCLREFLFSLMSFDSI